MSDDKSALDRLLEVAVFAPAGLAITMSEEFPKLVDKGRHRVEGQVHTARLVGQFAVQLGRRQVEQWTKRLDGDGDDQVAPTATRAGAAGGGAPSIGLDGASMAPSPAAPTTNGAMPSTHLAIPGYDSLSASQVVQRLDGLSSAELADVRAHELASRRRRTILSRVDQLLTGPPPESG